MLRSYMRRKRVEARLLAAEIAQLFTGAQTPAAQATPRRQPGAYERVSPDEMMSLIGAQWH